ncbi:MAG: DUF3157 family protein [Christensenellaceae bacterium]|jgi:hypothetical protein|nr:DUF3157 family protein [Christensenellaceae bacterium]
MFDFLAFLMFFNLFFWGGFNFPPELPPQDNNETIIQDSMDVLLDKFNVEINGNQINITNTSTDTYTWVVLELAFVNENGEIVKTQTAGAYSEIAPNQTVSIYVRNLEENTECYVYEIKNNYFITNPNQGVSNNA